MPVASISKWKGPRGASSTSGSTSSAQEPKLPSLGCGLAGGSAAAMRRQSVSRTEAGLRRGAREP